MEAKLKNKNGNNRDKTISNMLSHKILLNNYYKNYYKNMTARELDKEFNKDIITLIKAAKYLPENKRNSSFHLFSRLIEFHIEKKIEKEINSSFDKILKLL